MTTPNNPRDTNTQILSEDSLEKIEEELSRSFEQFRQAEGYTSATPVASKLAAQLFVRRMESYFRRLAVQQAEAVAAKVRVDAVSRIMSVNTEGLFDDGDLFIKRQPIEQVCVDLIGFDAFKAIQESLPTPKFNQEKPS